MTPENLTKERPMSTTETTPTRWTKKPVTIDARQWTGDNYDEIMAFAGSGKFIVLGEEDRANSDDPDCSASVYDKLHSTWVGVMDGQWIIRGVKGEFYPCDAEVFAETYEPARVTPSGDDPAERLLALQLPVEVLGVATLREHLTAGIAADVYLLAAQRDQAREVVAEILDMLGQDGHPDSLMLTEWRQRAGLEPRP
jgi:hypothetical protein